MMRCSRRARRIRSFVTRIVASIIVVVAATCCAPRIDRATRSNDAQVADHASATCRVSFDRSIWYDVGAGPLPPIEFREARCDANGELSADDTPPIPTWAIPKRTTRALFAATAFAEDYAPRGMRAIAELAHDAGVPVTWMVNDPRYLQFDRAFFDRMHRTRGDDLEIANNLTVYYYALPLRWFTRAVSIDGAGRERLIAGDRAQGARGFWGITWNSLHTDATSDRGAPWGGYCADPKSYKRPQAHGCELVGFEWTARDLTRAYLDDDPSRGYSAEAAFSTDPDDLIDRGGFTPTAAAAYTAHIIDAYAAAGESRPLLVLSQQEPLDEQRHDERDAPVLRALYARATHDGMRAVTLRTALASAPEFAADPRAIAFPFLSGGRTPEFDGTHIEPATIDYHDAHVGMTFLGGHTLPSRIFPYDRATVSRFDRPLPEVDDTSPTFPRLLHVAVDHQRITFTFASPEACRFGVAIWSDPHALGVREPDVTFAGRAGFVAAFDLPRGRSTQAVRCTRCRSTAFAYSR